MTIAFIAGALTVCGLYIIGIVVSGMFIKKMEEAQLNQEDYRFKSLRDYQ
jgi:hypothetical protein